jgi:hypothetical protein
VIKSISVDLGITTPDQLRHIDFGLEKDTSDDGTVSWTIDFKFQERNVSTDPFTDLVTLHVAISAQHDAAAQATATQGLSDAQVNHLNGSVTAGADQLKQNRITQTQYSRLVEETVPKHNA